MLEKTSHGKIHCHARAKNRRGTFASVPRYPYLKKENKNTLMLRFPFNIRARVPNFPLCTCSPSLLSLHGFFQTLKLQCFASVLPKGNPGLQFNVPRRASKATKTCRFQAFPFNFQNRIILIHSPTNKEGGQAYGTYPGMKRM